jgi:hypothetical protein
MSPALWYMRGAGIFVAMIWIIWSGIRPSSGDPRAWYDRVIRAVGGTIIFLALAWGFCLNLKDK